MKLMVHLLCYNPAKMLHIENNKGTIAKGKNADFFVWDPWTVSSFNDKDVCLKFPKMYVFNRKKCTVKLNKPS